MRTAVDSSVLLDLLLDDPTFSNSSRKALATARAAGALVICEVVVAEVVPVIGAQKFDEFLTDLAISFIPSTLESALMAGSMMSRYIERGGKRGRVVADFLIGAHASCFADQLLARDRGFYRDYFRKLKVIES